MEILEGQAESVLGLQANVAELAEVLSEDEATIQSDGNVAEHRADEHATDGQGFR